MRLSLNEIEVTVRKAALGAGLPLGLAEDAGAVAAWLAAGGFPVAALMQEALAWPHIAEPRLVRAGQIYRSVGGEQRCSALRVLPSACDLVLAAASGGGTAVEAVIDVPVLAVAQAAIVCAGGALPLAVEIEGRLRAATATGRAAVVGTAAELSELRSAPVRIRPARDEDFAAGSADLTPDLARARRSALEAGVRVGEAAWREIEALAARTLVPATAQSRERGAGAGLVDLD
ncbi:MAG: hypothetical protein K0S81_1726 [Rhodospirillales bacterium]|jgi:hypothetical protein|nr:hypothetical protein [Rhodospirillales bacterium]